jgi:plastocyanin
MDHFRHRSPAIAGLALLIACGGSTPSGNNGGGDGDIQATAGLQFVPGVLTITSGTSVTWDFGAVAHTVVFDPVAGRPADIAGSVSNQQVSRTFATTGTFPYHCTIHPEMSGEVRVTAPGGNVPPPPPPSSPPPPPPGYP